jgi:hypothetical protein
MCFRAYLFSNEVLTPIHVQIHYLLKNLYTLLSVEPFWSQGMPVVLLRVYVNIGKVHYDIDAQTEACYITFII